MLVADSSVFGNFGTDIVAALFGLRPTLLGLRPRLDADSSLYSTSGTVPFAATFLFSPRSPLPAGNGLVWRDDAFVGGLRRGVGGAVRDWSLHRAGFRLCSGALRALLARVPGERIDGRPPRRDSTGDTSGDVSAGAGAGSPLVDRASASGARGR